MLQFAYAVVGVLLVLSIHAAPILNKTDTIAKLKRGKLDKPNVSSNNDERNDLKINGIVAGKKIDPESLKRPDHLEGVRIERDGHLNKEFRKEVLMGKETNDVEENPDKVLKDIFTKADVNNDAELNQEELSNWIAKKVNEHLDQAVKENFYLFTGIDKNSDGLVTWQEYHVNFMMDQGFAEDYAKDHAENHKELVRKVREQILLDRAAFSEAAHTNSQGLNIDEFLSFRHPERSHVTLLKMVQDIFNNLDENEDGFLSLKEFTSFSAGSNNPELLSTDQAWKEERKREFEEAIDTNHDGKITRQELLYYSDPQNPAHAKTEARNLIALADSDRSGTLSLKEILAKKDMFIGSKMVNTAQKFHDEF